MNRSDWISLSQTAHTTVDLPTPGQLEKLTKDFDALVNDMLHLFAHVPNGPC